MIKLYPHQSDDIDAIRARLREGHKSVLYQLATGGGKTSGATFMAQSAHNRGMSVWFVVHRKELVDQTSETFKRAGLQHGLIASGRVYVPGNKVNIVMVGTVARKLANLSPPSMIIWDECHHLSAATYRAIYEWAQGTTHIGLSATPWRLDGTGLSGFFTSMVCGLSPAELTRRGYLSPYRLFGAQNEPDTSKVKHVAGDFSRKEIIGLMDRPQIVGDAVDHYIKHATGRSALLFDVSVESSEKQAEAFRARGIPWMHVDANTPDLDRRRAIKDLASGELRGLSNVDLFGEGVSVDNISCVIQKRPTESLTLHLQQIGRGLRMFPGKKDCVILDHAGNWRRHGLPDDEREWSLEGVSKEKRKVEGCTVRQCESCYAAFDAKYSACPECGWRPAPSIRAVDKVDGELAEVDTEAVRQANPMALAQGRAKSLDALMALGHSQSRAQHILAAREEKEALRNRLRALNPRMPYREILELKPKGLREWIAKLEAA